MATSEEFIVILHVDDGEQWANFLSTRLKGSSYGIFTFAKNISSVDSTFNLGSSTRSDSSQKSFNQRDSGEESTMSDTEDINNAKARVFLLSPEMISISPFPFDITLLNPRRSVFLLLGVEIEEVRGYFGKNSDHVFNSRCCVIQSDDNAVRDALVEIIKTFEDSGETSENSVEDYEIPPSPRQLNSIVKVMPRQLGWKDRDVYFVLERAAEESLVVILENSPEEIPVTCICDKLYTFTLPSNAHGEVSFRVDCNQYSVGSDSIFAPSKLDEIKAILDEEVSPLSLIALALELPSDDLESIDDALALKLRQLASVKVFQEMFPVEEVLNNTLTEDSSDVLYPTILHFAADWGLKKFCSVLLCYPNMLGAAVTENKNGDSPSAMASKKGYTDIQNNLQFVLENTTSDLYVEPSVPAQPSQPSLVPHRPAKPHLYINQPHSESKSSGLYIQMTAKPRSESTSQQTDLDNVSLTSQTSDNVFTYFATSPNNLNQGDHNPSTNMSTESPETGISKKALKKLGVTEGDIMKTSTLGKVYTRPDLPTNLYRDNIQHAVRFPGTTQFQEHDRSSLLNSYKEGVCHSDMKHKGNKISAFINKMKNKRSVSEGELVLGSGRQVEKSHSTRSEKQKKKSQDPSNQERDSGSYSDEENGKDQLRKNSKQKEFKERAKPLSRQRPMSKRVLTAKQEHIKDTPQLPTRASFKSYIDSTEQF